MMSKGDPRDGFFYPTLTLMVDSYILQHGISEPVFYAYLVYKVKRIAREPTFTDKFKKIILHYKKMIYHGYFATVRVSGYKIIVNSYGFLFNSMTVGHASDSMKSMSLNFR